MLNFLSPSLSHSISGLFHLDRAFWIHQRLSSCLSLEYYSRFRAVRCSLEAVGCISISLRATVLIALSWGCFVVAERHDYTLPKGERTSRSSWQLFNSNPYHYERLSCSEVQHSDVIMINIVPAINDTYATIHVILILLHQLHLLSFDFVGCFTASIEGSDHFIILLSSSYPPSNRISI